MSTGAPSGGTIHNIQVLRAAAALLVVGHHLGFFLLRDMVPAHVYAAGVVGVDLFFVISGFVMVLTTARRPTSPAGFALDRLIRVVPPYWLVTILFVGVFVAARGWSAMPATELQIVKSLLFVPYYDRAQVLMPVLYVGWTLNYELFFYALFTAALAIAGNRVSSVVAMVSGALVLLVGAGVVTQPASAIAAFFTRDIILEFAGGMLLALLYLRGRLPDVRVGQAMMWVGGTVLLALGSHAETLVGRGLLLGLPAMSVVGGALAVERGGRVLRNSYFERVGDWSYALYLVHPLVLLVGIAAAKRVGLMSSDAGVVALCVGLMAASLGAAWLLHVLIEKPVTSRLRAFIGHRRPVVGLS